MALVKYGGGIVQMSGSIGGTVFARNKSGNYARPRTKPVNPQSVRQESARADVTYLAEYWHQDMDADARGLWETYAKDVGWKNKLAETIHLSGFNMFMRSNCVVLRRGGAVIAAAPAIGALPEHDGTSYAHNTDIGTQVVQMHCTTDGWADNGDNKEFQHWYMGRPQLASRETFHGPYRWFGATNQVQGESGISVEFGAPYTFALGQKVWFRSRIETLSARVSTQWDLPPLTIPNGV